MIKMKKIFTYFANNGEWNGYYTRYVVAESAEEVVNSKDYQDYKNFGYYIGEVHEVTSKDICLALSLFSMTDKIEFSYKIKED